jgi:predicted enzyme related to lactoylglutathione lyase
MGRGVFWSTYVSVESADEAATKATQAGGSLAAAPFDLGDAGRTAAIADLSGAVFCVWEPKSHKGAEAVNANATWNWSELNTRDPDAAKSFYGTVFGRKRAPSSSEGIRASCGSCPVTATSWKGWTMACGAATKTSGPPRASEGLLVPTALARRSS